MPSPIIISAPEHPIKSVTVFKSSKAEVVRTFKLHLDVGQTKVTIQDLPSTIDTNTVRVSNIGDARLFDVVCTIGSDKDASYAINSLSEIIRRLSVEKETLESEKRVREHEASLLVDYAKTLTGEHVKPSEMSQFLEGFVEQGRKNLDAINTISEKIVQVSRKIEKESQKQLLKKGDARGEVVVIFGTDTKVIIDLKLTYIVSNVQWKSAYELHATTENGKPSPSVSLHYRARIKQSTGEDWKQTSLTLSTVTADTMVKRIPILHPIRIRPQFTWLNKNNNTTKDANRVPASTLFGAPQQQVAAPGGSTFGIFGGQQQQQQAPSFSIFGTQPPAQNPNPPPFSFGSSAFGSSALDVDLPRASSELALDDDQDFEDVEAPVSITEPTTIVTETPIAISYSVHGASSIPSDGIEHQVSVAVLPFEAVISYVSIPRIDPRVYLRCQVKNTSEYRLLPGPVSVILDDSHASNTSIGDVNIGDIFECSLGDDVVTKVTYSRVSRSAKVDGGSFSEDKKTVTYDTKITIHNKHAFAIPDLVVYDIIPTCDDKRAKVILRKPAGLADADAGDVITDSAREGLKIVWSKQEDGKGGKKEGRFEWRWDVAAGAKITLESQWEIRALADVPWVETTG